MMQLSTGDLRTDDKKQCVHYAAEQEQEKEQSLWQYSLSCS